MVFNVTFRKRIQKRHLVYENSGTKIWLAFFSQILMKIGYRVILKRRTQELHLLIESCAYCHQRDIKLMSLRWQYGSNQHNWPCKFMLPNVNLDVPREIKKLFYFEFHQFSIILNLLIWVRIRIKFCSKAKLKVF